MITVKSVRIDIDIDGSVVWRRFNFRWNLERNEPYFYRYEAKMPTYMDAAEYAYY